MASASFWTGFQLASGTNEIQQADNQKQTLWGYSSQWWKSPLSKLAAAAKIAETQLSVVLRKGWDFRWVKSTRAGYSAQDYVFSQNTWSFAGRCERGTREYALLFGFQSMIQGGVLGRNQHICAQENTKQEIPENATLNLSRFAESGKQRHVYHLWPSLALCVDSWKGHDATKSVITNVILVLFGHKGKKWRKDSCERCSGTSDV